jgi:hypothetical protein
MTNKNNEQSPKSAIDDEKFCTPAYQVKMIDEAFGRLEKKIDRLLESANHPSMPRINGIPVELTKEQLKHLDDLPREIRYDAKETSMPKEVYTSEVVSQFNRYTPLSFAIDQKIKDDNATGDPHGAKINLSEVIRHLKTLEAGAQIKTIGFEPLSVSDEMKCELQKAIEILEKHNNENGK